MKINKANPAIFLILISLFSGCGYISSAVNYNDPLTAEEHNNLGVAYESEGKYKQAEKQYKKAAKMDPELITPLVNLGNVYFKQGKYKNSEKYYLKALDKDRKNIEAANNLGNVYLEKGKGYETGIEYLVIAMPPPEIAPAYALDTLGMLYASTGNLEKASVLLRLACQRAEKGDEIVYEISDHLTEIGETDCQQN